MNDTIINNYALLILKKGINIKKGQCIRITATKWNYDFALKLLEHAYKLQARYVKIDIVSDYELLYRSTNSQIDYLDYTPDFNFSINNTFIAENWAFISLTNTDEFDILKDAPSENVQTIMKGSQMARKKLRDAMMVDKLSWCVAAYPGVNWANRIYKSQDKDNLAKFEDTFVNILRLNHPDPIAEWEKHGLTLKERCKKLNSLKIDRLVFTTPSGELEIGLNKTSIWHGGPAYLPDGSIFMPNLPTEEVFTTPDYRRTSGKINVVKPVEVFGTIVKDLKLEFKEGKVSSFSASHGEDMMEKYLSIDNNSSYLGEVALVDESSPINRSGLYFDSILFDENASSHIALGGGYPSCIENGDKLTEDKDKLLSGCNVSSVHTDFMVGDQNTKVTGFTISGDKIEIMKDGKILF